MNLATRITVTRIMLTPVFLGLLLYYKNASGPHSEWLRIAAIFVFFLAVFTDALDGFIARTRSQKTVLGTYLDPLADKFLIISAIIMMTLPIKGLGFRFCWRGVYLLDIAHWQGQQATINPVSGPGTNLRDLFFNRK